MRYKLLLLLGLSSVASASDTAQYLPSIQQRWDASDLVCTGRASSPARTGQTENIDGSDRDELAAQVAIETCFKGELAVARIRVLGYDFEVTVPIFATSIHLADTDPYRASDRDRPPAHGIVIRELEEALIQFGGTDLTYIDYLFDYLGVHDGIAELSNLSLRRASRNRMKPQFACY